MKKRIGVIISDPKERSILKYYPGPTIMGKNCPLQEIFCYNAEKEDNIMSCIVFYKDNDAIYLASDSLNVRYDANGTPVERRYIPKIFAVGGCLIATCGLTALRRDGQIVEISEIIQEAKINTFEDEEKFLKYLQKLMNESQDINKNLPLIKNNIEVMIANIYDNKLEGNGYTITLSEINNHPLSLHQFQLWGDYDEFPEGYESSISKIGVRKTLKNIVNNAIVKNGRKTIDGPVQLWRLEKSGKISQ